MLTLPHLKTLDIGRWLLIGLSITILFSTFLSNVIEITLLGLFIFNKDLRARFWHFKNQPLLLASGLFICLLFVDCFYSVAPVKETLESLWGWRKILLLPLGLVLFNDVLWKNKFAYSLMIFVSIVSLFCIPFYLLELNIHGAEPGVLIRNHSTQGMIFSATLFLMGMFLLFKTHMLPIRSLWILVFMLMILGVLVYMTPGRSGYLAFIMMTVYFGYLLFREKLYKILSLVLLLSSTLLVSSPVVQDRIDLGVKEMHHVDPASIESSSMGLRMTLWKNTIELIQDRPLLGFGTGGFEEAYRQKIKDNPDWEKNIIHDPHNQFLKIWAEMGMLGLIIFLSMLTSSLFQKSSKMYFHLGIGVLIAWCATSLFSSHFSTFTEGRFIYIWLGIMLASESNKIKR
ncbi:O-antigen ligase family protein [Candidatus Methylopumilus rimovensis]|uniref:O-antigen ligase family protein n=1 Tax=Candidatus Methylopumilus rimovensis TaxID=2588535 RepID=UPI001124B3DA|nr:O-antigen ligase family protein [Candidatus Methylopumilus rimovensis]QDD12068.1 O-antigen ligase family protein [Candidatus Methylopumilus rimovensis]